MARDALVLETARGQYGLVSRQQALQAGMSEGTIDERIRRSEWESAGVGVYRLPGVPVTWHQRALAACLQCAPFGALSHRSAAYVYRLDGVGWGPPEPIEIVIPHGHELKTDLKVRVTRRFDRAMYKAMPITPVSRTLIDLAAELSETDLELAVDSALRKGPRALTALKQKLNELPRRGRNGLTHLGELVAAYDGTLDSALEVLVRQLLWAAGLPKPVPQFNVWHRRRWIARVDFAWPKQKLVVQAHGLKWHLNARRCRIDYRQQSEMQVAGWLPMVTTWHEVTKQPARFIDLMRDAWATQESKLEGSAVAQPGKADQNGAVLQQP